jgi:hypothetical protein
MVLLVMTAAPVVFCAAIIFKSASLTAAGRRFTPLLGIIPTLRAAVFSDPSYT